MYIILQTKENMFFPYDEDSICIFCRGSNREQIGNFEVNILVM
jgi:hypothetical protein